MENKTQTTLNTQNTVIQGKVLQEEIINGLIQFLDKQNSSIKK